MPPPNDWSRDPGAVYAEGRADLDRAVETLKGEIGKTEERIIKRIDSAEEDSVELERRLRAVETAAVELRTTIRNYVQAGGFAVTMIGLALTALALWK